MSPLALATHTTGPEALKRMRVREEYEAFVSLAVSQRRRSWAARREARECEAAADLPGYREAAKQARKAWRDAVWNLQRARDRKGFLDG